MKKIKYVVFVLMGFLLINGTGYSQDGVSDEGKVAPETKSENTIVTETVDKPVYKENGNEGSTFGNPSETVEVKTESEIKEEEQKKEEESKTESYSNEKKEETETDPQFVKTKKEKKNKEKKKHHDGEKGKSESK
jgi:hypothetical protein